MQQYLKLLKTVLRTGDAKSDRTGTGTISSFGHQMKFNMDDGFPLVTTKRVHWKSIVYELLWMLKGDTNVKFLNDNKVTIWDEWADEQGNLGPVYGHQWRNFRGVDQIAEAIELLKHNPDSRRIIVNSWDASLLPDTDKTFSENVAAGKQALPPCHMMFQFNTRSVQWEQDDQGVFRRHGEHGKIYTQLAKRIDDIAILPERFVDLQIYIRSNDLFLGCPFNIAQYALLLHIIAQLTDKIPGNLVVTIGDAHIYSNHIEQVKTQLERKPYALPQVLINPQLESIDDLVPEDIVLNGYEHHPAIKGDVAI